MRDYTNLFAICIVFIGTLTLIALCIAAMCISEVRELREEIRELREGKQRQPRP